MKPTPPGVVALLAALLLAPSAPAQPAVVMNLGPGCAPPAPVLTITPPVIGQPLTVTVSSPFPNAMGFVILSTPLSRPFPVVSGCTIYLDVSTLVALFQFVTDSSGNFSATFTLPFDLALVGQSLHVQSSIWALGGPVLNDYLSNGLKITIGTSALCVGAQSPILHQPSGPDIPWPFVPGVFASADIGLSIVSSPLGDRARFEITDTSANLPQGMGETAGVDALSFNLPFFLAPANINVISPSTFKELRRNTTPGRIFGEFDWEVRRHEHDGTPFVFEIHIPGTDLTIIDFITNGQGFRFVARINGILFMNEPENRAFSACQ